MNKKLKILKISKIINILALSFLLGGAYGLVVTGFLQIIAAVIFTFAFPKNQLIYIYFVFVFLFFFRYGGNIFGWQFAVPACLMVLLTYIIHFHNSKLL